MEIISKQERSAILSNEISKYISRGFKLVEKNESNFSAILHRDAEKTNHLLHLILTIVTCFLWVLIWGGIALTRKGAWTVDIYIDEFGNAEIS
jgi:hypothetical protein